MKQQLKKFFLWFAFIDVLIIGVVVYLYVPQNLNQKLIEPLLISRDEIDSIDIGVVLGAGLRPGGEVSNLAQERVDYMLPIAEEENISFIFSGGETPRGIEAIAMNEYAKDHGYTGLDHIEASSHSTYENAFYTDQLLDQDLFEDDRVLIVTSPSHARRAKAVFETVMPERTILITFPDDTVLLEDTPYGRLKGARAILREYVATAWYKMRYGINL